MENYFYVVPCEGGTCNHALLYSIRPLVDVGQGTGASKKKNESSHSSYLLDQGSPRHFYTLAVFLLSSWTFLKAVFSLPVYCLLLSRSRTPSLALSLVFSGSVLRFVQTLVTVSRICWEGKASWVPSCSLNNEGCRTRMPERNNHISVEPPHHRANWGACRAPWWTWPASLLSVCLFRIPLYSAVLFEREQWHCGMVIS